MIVSSSAIPPPSKIISYKIGFFKVRQTCPRVCSATSAHWLPIWPINVDSSLPFSLLGDLPGKDQASPPSVCSFQGAGAGCQLREKAGNSLWSGWLQSTHPAPLKLFWLASQACQRTLKLPCSPCGCERYTLITHPRGEIGVTGAGWR